MKKISKPIVIVECSKCTEKIGIALRGSNYTSWKVPRGRMMVSRLNEQGWIETENDFYCETCKYDDHIGETMPVITRLPKPPKGKSGKTRTKKA